MSFEQEDAAGAEEQASPATEDRRTQFASQRRHARALGMQMMFEADFSARPLDDILTRRFSEERLPPPVAEYAESLLRGAWEHRGEYDEMIARAAPSWPLEQMARIDRNILRIAMYEMLHGEAVPVRAAINEAVELAKEYGSDASRRFINGVLGTIAAEYTPTESKAVAPGDQ